MSLVHICGAVVHAVPSKAESVAQALTAFSGCEMTTRIGGKLAITVEATGDAGALAIIDRIRELPGVLSVVMTYHHCEDEAAMNEEIEHDHHAS
jgi:nitrate reductase NapD